MGTVDLRDAMGNLITIDRFGPEHCLQLSNGGTTVLLSVLLLGGSDSAASVWEQQLMTWLAEHDQGVFGAGMVGFELDEIAWDAESFADQQRFVLDVIDLALQRRRWDELSYDPPAAAAQLRALRTLVAGYRPDPDAPAVAWSWRTPPEQLVRCERHRVFRHANGCLLCHDGE